MTSGIRRKRAIVWWGGWASVLIATYGGGCAAYVVRPASIDSAELDYTSKTLHSFWWGLTDEPVLSVEPGVDVNDVRIVDNIGYDLIGVLTLGIWKPLEIQYRQRAPMGSGTEGTIGGSEPAVPASEPGHE